MPSGRCERSYSWHHYLSQQSPTHCCRAGLSRGWRWVGGWVGGGGVTGTHTEKTKIRVAKFANPTTWRPYSLITIQLSEIKKKQKKRKEQKQKIKKEQDVLRGESYRTGCCSIELCANLQLILSNEKCVCLQRIYKAMLPRDPKHSGLQRRFPEVERRNATLHSKKNLYNSR